MIHYKSENFTLDDLWDSVYPHTPEDRNQSIQDYLEAKLEDGWELVSMTLNSSNRAWWVFRANGRNT